VASTPDLGVRKLVREGKLRTTRPCDAVLVFRESVEELLKAHEIDHDLEAARIAEALTSGIAKSRR